MVGVRARRQLSDLYPGDIVDLSLSEEQQLLQSAVARVVQARGGVEQRRRLRSTPLGFDPAVWREFAALGWLALPFAETDGGLGGSAIDLMVLMEQLGRGLVAEPYLPTVVICGRLLAAGDATQRVRHITPLIAGEQQWAFAFAEPAGRYDLAEVRVTARASGAGFVLDGGKIAVLNAQAADWLIVSARTADPLRQRRGVSLFIVHAQQAGVARESLALVDGSRGAHLDFSGVTVGADALLGPLHDALPLIEDTAAHAIVAMGAEALGAMEALLEQTVAYSRNRVQFGQPIGSFQALQHRMADMYLQCQAMRSLVYHAAIARAEDRADAPRAASALKVKLGEAGRFVAQQAVQLHGGIGMTDELAVGHYFKRLMLLNTLFGDAEHHLQRYIELAQAH
jgi:hypothetical protein